MNAEPCKYGVCRDEGRGSFFWVAFKGIPPTRRTKPIAHGWQPTEDAAVAAAKSACPGFPVRDATIALWCIEWKQFAAPGWTKKEKHERFAAEYRARYDDLERRLRAAQAEGKEAEFWETSRQRMWAMRELLFGADRIPEPLAALGLRAGATPDEIKAAYRAKAKTEHPDAGGSSERFIRLTNAYKAALYLAGAA